MWVQSALRGDCYWRLLCKSHHLRRARLTAVALQVFAATSSWGTTHPAYHAAKSLRFISYDLSKQPDGIQTKQECILFRHTYGSDRGFSPPRSMWGGEIAVTLSAFFYLIASPGRTLITGCPAELSAKALPRRHNLSSRETVNERTKACEWIYRQPFIRKIMVEMREKAG